MYQQEAPNPLSSADPEAPAMEDETLMTQDDGSYGSEEGSNIIGRFVSAEEYNRMMRRNGYDMP